MSKNISTRLLCLLLSLALLGGALFACAPTPDEPPTKTYNVVFSLATIPPVLAALDCVENGNETFVIIERGKTYSGISQLESFHNEGFDPANNTSLGFDADDLSALVQRVSDLKAQEPDAFFNIYVQDGTALLGAAIAANAGLSLDKFHVYMGEDGTGAYNALREAYIKNKAVTETEDAVWDSYKAAVAAAKAEFDAIMAKTDNAITDAPFSYNIGKAFALAALDNFTYCLQDKEEIANILEGTGEHKSLLLSAFGVEGYKKKTEYSLNLRYQKISEGVAKLPPEKRADYLTLMYGDYYKDTFDTLTRTKRAGEEAPAKKLVFIGSRHSGYPTFASNDAYGIGGLTGPVPSSYAELDDKYKTSILFATEEDYNAFYSILANDENYGEDVTPETKALAQTDCFNIYIDYIFNLKLIYALYGDRYDLIMKGHPREVIGEWEQWGARYKVTGSLGQYAYDKLLDAALLGFHKADSVGKYIGMVPYGTAAENLAYLGADISLCGLPSSTYNGYEPSVEVLFVSAATNEDIRGTVSQVAERYNKGNLFYTDIDGTRKTTQFLNVANVYKNLVVLYLAEGDTDSAALYLELYASWLSAQGYKNIDAQGIATN